MINEMTQKQREVIPCYVDKWLKRGLSTECIDKEAAIQICNRVQTELLGRAATPVIILDNPVQAWVAVCICMQFKQDWDQVRDQVRYQVWGQVLDQVWDKVEGKVLDQVWKQVQGQVQGQVWDQVWDQVWKQVQGQVQGQVREQVRDQVRYQVRYQVLDQVWGQVREQVRDQVWGQVREQVLDQVWGQVREQVEDQVREQVSGKGLDFIIPYLMGAYDSSTFAFYDFMQNELNVHSDLWDKFKVWSDTYKLGFIYPLENICIVSQKPKVIKMVDGKLHCENGPAIQFAGGFCIWSLYGVRVPQWLVETSSENLRPEQYNDLKNADVKSEFIRKIGIDRMISYGKIVDRWSNYSMGEWWERSEYELIDINALFSTLNYVPFLKMKNQTTGIYHMEAVSPECKTIKEALDDRYGINFDEYEIEEIK